jgi:hypothetical protein
MYSLLVQWQLQWEDVGLHHLLSCSRNRDPGNIHLYNYSVWRRIVNPRAFDFDIETFSISKPTNGKMFRANAIEMRYVTRPSDHM